MDDAQGNEAAACYQQPKRQIGAIAADNVDPLAAPQTLARLMEAREEAESKRRREVLLEQDSDSDRPRPLAIKSDEPSLLLRPLCMTAHVHGLTKLPWC